MLNKNINYTLPEHDCLITGNHLLLRSAFYNLFENAVKYNKYGGSIEILFQKKHNGQISVLICDTGIGMNEEEVALAFEPFFRVNRLCVQQIPGNGLGLPIIKTIIARHGGEIEIESKIDVGTKVIIIL